MSFTLVERIRRGEAAIAKAKAQGRDVKDWEAHLEGLRRQLPTVDLTEGRLVAVKIASAVLDCDIWLAFRDDFKPDEGETLAVFYADEIPFLKDKDAETLREIHKTKLVFPDARVRQ